MTATLLALALSVWFVTCLALRAKFKSAPALRSGLEKIEVHAFPTN